MSSMVLDVYGGDLVAGAGAVMSYRPMSWIRMSRKEGNMETRRVDVYTGELTTGTS
jgi:hypothetical protein